MHTLQSVTPMTGVHRFRNWLIAAAMLVVSSVIFLCLLAYMEHISHPGDTSAPRTIDLYISEQPITGTDDLTAISVPLTSQPGYMHIDPDRLEYSLFVHEFERPETGEDLGIYLRWARRIVEVEVNGQVVRSQTPIDFWGTLGGFEPVAYIIPSEILQPGTNELGIRVNGRSRKILPEFFIAPARSVLDAIGWGRLISVYMNVGAVAALIVLILICSTARWPRNEQRKMRALIGLLVMWAFRNLTFLGADELVPHDFVLSFHFLTTYLFLLSILNFALAWTNAEPKWQKPILPFFGLLLIATPALYFSPYGTSFFFGIAFVFETALTFFVCMLSSVLLARYYARLRPLKIIEPLLFLVSFASVFVDAIDDRWDIYMPVFQDLPLTFYSAPMFGLLLGLGLCATFASQATATSYLLTSINQELEARVAAQKQELEKGYESQRELEKRKAQDEERRRILRDMHDGVGSLLLGLSVQIKAGKLSMPDISEGIQKGIDDLRLMVTAMDSVGDDLSDAMDAFRSRVSPQLDAANIELDWAMNIDAHNITLPPRHILNLYRILQEAISNAIRHSKADRVKVSFDSAPTGAAHFILTICDNGDGYPDDAVATGRGLSNMKRRARALGADLETETSDAGTTIRLSLSQATEDS